jgi:hypothetical protein
MLVLPSSMLLFISISCTDAKCDFHKVITMTLTRHHKTHDQSFRLESTCAESMGIKERT